MGATDATLSGRKQNATSQVRLRWALAVVGPLHHALLLGHLLVTMAPMHARSNLNRKEIPFQFFLFFLRHPQPARADDEMPLAVITIKKRQSLLTRSAPQRQKSKSLRANPHKQIITRPCPGCLPAWPGV
jgi:hypothetical protein